MNEGKSPVPEHEAEQMLRRAMIRAFQTQRHRGTVSESEHAAVALGVPGDEHWNPDTKSSAYQLEQPEWRSSFPLYYARTSSNLMPLRGSPVHRKGWSRFSDIAAISVPRIRQDEVFLSLTDLHKRWNHL